MSAFSRQVAVETRLLLRRKDDLFWTLVFPVFFMVLYGIIYGNQTWDAYGMRAIDFLLPGVVVMAMLVTGIMGTAGAFVEEREKGIYRRLSLTPLKRRTLISGQIVQRYLVMVVQTLVILVVATLAFKVKIVGNYVLFWLVFTCGALCLLSLGYALATVIRSLRSATPIVMIVFFVLMFLGGIFIPTTIMPGFLKVFSNSLPSTHLGEALRLVMVNGAGIGEIWKNLLVVGGWTVGCLVVAIKFFRWE